MNIWVVLIFGSAAVLAILLLYFFRAKAWYWHVLSVVLAVVIGKIPIGSMPIPQEWMDKPASFGIGFIFVFLTLWGIGAPFFRPKRSLRQQ